MVGLINWLDRKVTMVISFFILAVLLLATFASFEALFHHQQGHVGLIVLWMVMSFFFSAGPNTLTFIVRSKCPVSCHMIWS